MCQRSDIGWFIVLTLCAIGSILVGSISAAQWTTAVKDRNDVATGNCTLISCADNGVEQCSDERVCAAYTVSFILPLGGYNYTGMSRLLYPVDTNVCYPNGTLALPPIAKCYYRMSDVSETVTLNPYIFGNYASSVVATILAFSTVAIILVVDFWYAVRICRTPSSLYETL